LLDTGQIARTLVYERFEMFFQLHAAGGIFSRPHIGLIAEKGPEAIIPLNKPGNGFLGSIHVHSAPVFNVGPGADQGSLTQALSEYARELAYEIKKQFAIEAEQSAVV
jgi:hypothetical protein